eukprot:12610-Eustigmatos_ZCMA.PRE.1
MQREKLPPDPAAPCISGSKSYSLRNGCHHEWGLYDGAWGWVWRCFCAQSTKHAPSLSSPG